MPKKREKLEITCGDSKCDAGQHSFRQIKPRNQERPPPSCCTSCGAAPVDWQVVRARDPSRIDEVIRSFKKEHIRAHFWDCQLSDKSKKRPLAMGRSQMKQRVRSRLQKTIGSARAFRDGTQTPLLEDGDPIHYAQHATATCCRKCVFCWHGIPEGRDLGERELRYLESLVWRYLDKKLPELNDKQPS
jgi:hypothetical protein